MEQAKKIKILVATGIFPPDIGGPATYVLTLANELPKHGFEVNIITYSDNSSPSFKGRPGGVNGLNQYYQICKISRKQNIIKRYWKYFVNVYLLLGSADLVYIQGPVSEGLPAWLACKLKGKPYLLKVVGDYAWESFQNSKFKIQNSKFISPDEFQGSKYDIKTELLRKIERLVARGAEKVITPSEYLKKIVIAWGVKEEKIRVIYNAVESTNSPVIPAPSPVIPAQAGIQNYSGGLDPGLHRDGNNIKQSQRNELNLNGFILLTVGRFVPWKGFDKLIELMPELLAVEPNFKLIIIGDGPEREKLELRSKKLEIESSIKFTGKIDKKLVNQYMQASDLFVLNTGYEGLSHAIIEAMQAGLPIVTTDIGGNPELIENGKNGLLFAYNNTEQLRAAVLKIRKNPELAENFRIANQAKLRCFAKERMIEKLVIELNQAPS